MAYEEFQNKNLDMLKIAQKAKIFGIQTLQNETLLSSFFATKISLTQSERENIAKIFTSLMQIEQNAQLSK
ncbi:hypothetical protein LMG7974_00510 [Campylobacter majalis]|uniref:Uncharacterized protein n=1 Tax=Campylobacter majalis TaxID=2790656 RepID=A0ABM8Q441_9BACT|nr:acetyltransferase [Campylobacter majalis]CAD7287631.1 hypothetical protein LMG7974_00510 [Campylobacter majalis]